MKKNVYSKVLATTISMLAIFNFSIYATEETQEPSEEKTTQIKLKDRPEKNQAQEQDEYFEEGEQTDKVENTSDKKKKSKKKKSSNPFDGFFTPKQNEYHFYETISLSTGTIGYGIKGRQAEVFLIPETTKIGIQFYFQSSWFDFIIDSQDVSVIAESLTKYLEDFESKKLIKNKTAKTRVAYLNNGKCRVEWGTMKSMMNNYGDTKYHIGYEFKKNSPYFTIIIKDAKNIAQDIGTNVSQNSVEIQLYFTKAQAKHLVEVIGIERLKQEKEDVEGEIIYQGDDY